MGTDAIKVNKTKFARLFLKKQALYFYGITD